MCPDGLSSWASLFRDHIICRTRWHRDKRRLPTTCANRFTHVPHLRRLPSDLSIAVVSFQTQDQSFIHHYRKDPEGRHSWPGQGPATPTTETVVPARQRFATAVTHVVNRRSNVVARSQLARGVPPKALPANIASRAAMASGPALC